MPHETITLTIDAASHGMRMDRLLRKLLPFIPLAHVHQLLRTGKATSPDQPGKKLTASDRLDPGTRVAISLAKADAMKYREKSAAPVAAAKAPKKTTPRLRVVYEDDHFLAFDKPSGIAAHPGSGHELSDTVLGALLERVKTSSRIFKPALVGRLDRDTSGLQLAGKTPEGVRGLEALSRSRWIHKMYWALARGPELPNQGMINAPLLDGRQGGKRMKVTDGESDPHEDTAVPAVTRYRVIGRGMGGACLVEVRPETGRMHQIRAHFASVKAPLAGDVRYGIPAWNRELQVRGGLRRLFLHCGLVSFRHPVSGKTMEISSPLPEPLRLVLTRLTIDAPE